MSATNLPTPQDAATARRILLGELAREVRLVCQELARRDGPRPGRAFADAP